MREIRDRLRAFNAERDWSQFHSPENLAKSVAIEAGELLVCFQWNGSGDEQAVGEEIADVMLYCIMLADHMHIDPKQAMLAKIEKNERKYPVDKAKGKSLKYTELE